MTAYTAPAGAGRMDHVHGDEDQLPEYTSAEEAAIERRAAELLTARMADPAMFADLMAGINPIEIDGNLHRALMNLDKACSGDLPGLNAIRTALCHIQRTIFIEARKVWRDEVREQAEKELAEGD